MAERSNETTVHNSGGVGVVGLLGVVFVTLKLCKVIDWPWWLVTLPFWGGAVLALVFVISFLAWLFWPRTK